MTKIASAHFATPAKVAAMLVTATLAACGGGGSSGGSSNSTAAVADVVSASGNLQMSVPAATYTGGSMKQQAFQELNASRQASGAGLVAQSSFLDTAAQAHADYINDVAVRRVASQYTGEALTRSVDLHTEYADLSPLFYATYNGDRTVKAGYVSGATGYFSTESITAAFTFSGSVIEDGTACIKTALNTVYHAEAVLSRATDVGIGRFLDDAGNPGCVVHVAAKDLIGQVPAANNVIVNPAPSATVNGTFQIDAETPRPASGLVAGPTAGHPVLVNMRNATFVNAQARGAVSAAVSTFVVRDGSNAVINGVFLGGANVSATTGGPAINSDSKLGNATIAFVPSSPLAAGTYTVAFAASINGSAINRTWSFTAQ